MHVIVTALTIPLASKVIASGCISSATGMTIYQALRTGSQRPLQDVLAACGLCNTGKDGRPVPWRVKRVERSHAGITYTLRFPYGKTFTDVTRKADALSTALCTDVSLHQDGGYLLIDVPQHPLPTFITYPTRILELCGVCSTDHVAQLYAHTTRPAHRAWTVLEHLRQRGYVESWRPSLTVPALHRLTREVRRRYDLPLVRWNGHVWHRVAVTDVFMGFGMPSDFIVEPRPRYEVSGESHVLCPDAYTQGLLLEVQRSPMTAAQWAEKRRQYERFFISGAWVNFFEDEPTVVFVQKCGQQLGTVGAGNGYQLHVVNDVQEVFERGLLRDNREINRQSSGQEDRK